MLPFSAVNYLIKKKKNILKVLVSVNASGTFLLNLLRLFLYLRRLITLLPLTDRGKQKQQDVGSYCYYILFLQRPALLCHYLQTHTCELCSHTTPTVQKTHRRRSQTHIRAGRGVQTRLCVFLSLLWFLSRLYKSHTQTTQQTFVL